MKNKIKYLPVSILTLTTVVSGASLVSANVAAETSASTTARVTVTTACSFTTDSVPAVNINLVPGGSGNTESVSGKTSPSIVCNDPSGFTVSAVGFSPDSTHPDGYSGNTSLYSTSGTIATGTASTAGENSYWSFKVTSVTPSGASITPAYNNTYNKIPSTPTQILAVSSATSPQSAASFRTDYQAYVNLQQPSGAYAGKVKYTITPSV